MLWKGLKKENSEKYSPFRHVLQPQFIALGPVCSIACHILLQQQIYSFQESANSPRAVAVHHDSKVPDSLFTFSALGSKFHLRGFLTPPPPTFQKITQFLSVLWQRWSVILRQKWEQWYYNKQPDPWIRLTRLVLGRGLPCLGVGGRKDLPKFGSVPLTTGHQQTLLSTQPPPDRSNSTHLFVHSLVILHRQLHLRGEFLKCQLDNNAVSMSFLKVTGIQHKSSSTWPDSQSVWELVQVLANTTSKLMVVNWGNSGISSEPDEFKSPEVGGTCRSRSDTSAVLVCSVGNWGLPLPLSVSVRCTVKAQLIIVLLIDTLLSREHNCMISAVESLTS